MKKRVVYISLAILLAGCRMAPNSPDFEVRQVETAHFSIAVWEKNNIQKGTPLRIYFEGDGTPNPAHAVAFDLAQADSKQNVIYVARPCQWVNDKICNQKPQVYKEARFHTEIMKEMKELTEYLIRKHKAPSVELVGYDGGAVIALNLATKLPTDRVITVAGITDINAYNMYHDLPQTEDNDIENPADNLAALETIPQIHYVGKNDNITPKKIVERFVARMKNPKSAIVKLVPDVDHTNWRGVKLDY